MATRSAELEAWPGTVEPGTFAAALLLLEPLLRHAIARSAAPALGPTTPHLRGLVCGPEEAAALLDEALRAEPLGAGVAAPALREAYAPLADLADAFGLADEELLVLLLALAPEADERLARLFGVLADDLTHTRPSAGLLADLAAPSMAERARLLAGLAGEGALRRLGLVRLTGGAEPLARRMVEVDPQIRNYLLLTDTLDEELARWCRVDRAPPPAWAAADAITGAIAAAPPGVLQLLVAPLPDAAAIARAVAAARRERLVIADAAALAEAGPDAITMLDRLLREAWLRGATVAIDRPAALDTAPPALREALAVRLGALPAGAIAFAADRWHPGGGWPGGTARHLMDRADPIRSARAWVEHGGVTEADAHALAQRLRLYPSDIAGATASAAPERDVAALSAAARRGGGNALERLAQRIVPRFGFERLVVPADVAAALNDLLLLARSRHVVAKTGLPPGPPGVVALFAGPSGTGKSLAAEILAYELELDLFRADTSRVVDKYIGETEKNLEALFAAAEDAQAVLLFDEAESLFGKRSDVTDARDRYANQEVAYLLQRLERFDGLAVLSTNLIGSLDEAFVRRVHPVYFPFPSASERTALWRLAFADEPAIDCASLGERHLLTGGHIHAAARMAAVIALDAGRAVSMDDAERAIAREFARLGRPVIG